MRIRLHSTVPGWARGALAMVLALALLGSAPAQLRRGGTAGRGFRVVVYYESIPGMKAQTNLVKSLLRGSQGVFMTNGIVRITHSRIETYPPRSGSTNLVAISPESDYDPDTHLIYSTNALLLQALDGRLILRGRTGYEFSATNNHLFISNYVRGFIQNGLFQTPNP